MKYDELTDEQKYEIDKVFQYSMDAFSECVTDSINMEVFGYTDDDYDNDEDAYFNARDEVCDLIYDKLYSFK